MKYLRSAFFVFGFLVISACSVSQDKKTAEDEVQKFHSAFNAGEFHAIYSASADELKQTENEEDFVKLLAALNRKLGKLENTTQNTWHVNSQFTGTFVVLVYKSKYEHGDANEQFTYLVKDKVAKLAGYNINSNALITQ